jgi:tyrosyl-tRNA synthetase
MDIETKLDRISSIAEEVITRESLKEILEANAHPVAYDGFEPSGIAPIYFGPTRARNLNLLSSVGIRFKLYIADYFAFINNKYGGDLEKIQKVGRYFIEVWKASGIDTDKVEIVWASKLMDNLGYWDRFMRVGRAVTLDRTRRAVTIMGRREGDVLSTAQLFYPIMQVSDIFQMDIDICQLGMDQRRANILAREVAHKYGWKTPAVVHHPLVMGLQGIPQPDEVPDGKEEAAAAAKMSKSKPESAIYVHDSEKQIREKVAKAYCPEGVVEGNPLINYLQILVLSDKSAPITIERPQKFGGSIELADFGDLVEKYRQKKIHPMDLKNFVAAEFEKIIRPVRTHFEKNSAAKQLYEEVKTFQITR